MNVSRIIISNILGVEHMDITPGTVTQVTGANGVGKTSIITAIKSSLKGGHDATLLRKGAEKGEVVLLLDDGTEIKKTITAEKSDLKVKGPMGKGGVGLLDNIRDIVSVNPIEFLTAEPKRQCELLLESIDIELTEAELREAVGFDVQITGSALETIGALHKTIYDERTGVNRAIKEKKSTHAQLCETVPTAVGGDPTEEIAACDRAIKDAETKRDALISDIETQKQSDVDRINEWKSSEIDRINAEATAQLQDLITNTTALVDAAKADFTNATSLHTERRTILQEQLTQRGRFDQQRKIIEQMETELEALEQEEVQKTAALKALLELKARKMEDMPFPGLAIIEGKVLIDGIPFERINSSEQVKFAINLAIRRAGDLKLICVDGLELIDALRYEKFIAAAKAMTDYQFIVTRVSNQPLSVETM